MRYNKRGFTLVELIVVIAIIGILATIILVSYGNLQAKSRDSKRKADLQAIASALSVYYADNKSYIKTDNWYAIDLNYSLDKKDCTNPSGNENHINCLKAFISSTPQDPKYVPNQNYHYYYIGDVGGTGYKIASDPRSNVFDAAGNPIDTFETSGTDATKCIEKAGEFADNGTWAENYIINNGSSSSYSAAPCSHFQVSSSSAMRDEKVKIIFPGSL